MKTPKTLNKGWWISLGVVVIVAILAVVIFVKPATKTPAPIAEPTTSTTAQAVTGCNVPTGDTSSTPAMPKDLRWVAAKGWTWPVSDTYGPTQAKSGYGICFARSPLGAALALTTVYGEANTRDPKAALTIYAVDSVGKSLVLSQPVTTETDTAGVGPITFAGFSTDAYTPDEAQITLVFSLAKSPTGYMGLPATLDWVDGDWKIKLLDNGSMFAGKATTPVDGQFAKWGSNNG